MATTYAVSSHKGLSHVRTRDEANSRQYENDLYYRYLLLSVVHPIDFAVLSIAQVLPIPFTENLATRIQASTHSSAKLKYQGFENCSRLPGGGLDRGNLDRQNRKSVRSILLDRQEMDCCSWLPLSTPADKEEDAAPISFIVCCLPALIANDETGTKYVVKRLSRRSRGHDRLC